MGRCEQVIPNSGNVKKAEQAVKIPVATRASAPPSHAACRLGWFLLPSLACVCGPRGWMPPDDLAIAPPFSSAAIR
ncbi:MAG: hypothetical protein WHU94_13555 [Thermogemmata sp.]